MKSAPTVDNSGAEAAAAASAKAQEAANNMQKNFAADLKNENITTVTPGGGAEASTAINPGRKRKGQASLSSSLGLDV